MKRLLLLLATLMCSRATTPLVLFCFLLVYIGIAFFSPEPLTSLLSLTATTPLSLLLAIVPLNCGVRLFRELCRFLNQRAAMNGAIHGVVSEELYDERCEIAGASRLDKLQDRFGAAGYHTRLTADSLAVWRGVTLAPARMLLLASLCTLFAGILLSITLRSSQREMVIEGEPFPGAVGGGETVKRIVLDDYRGLFLKRTVAIEVEGGNGSRRFGLYPPSLYGGRFIYPRYLGIAPLIRFAAPDLREGFETFFLLAIYPPGKEDSAVIPGSPYRIVFSMQNPEDGDEPFRSGRFALLFKVLKGENPVVSGTLPMGGSWEKDGYLLSLPDFRRTMTVDLVRDYGVLFIWVSGCFGLVALCCWLPFRVFSSRREMLFVRAGDATVAYSRSEGGRVRHGGMFHEALDLLSAGRSADRLPEDEENGLGRFR